MRNPSVATEYTHERGGKVVRRRQKLQLEFVDSWDIDQLFLP